MKNRIYTSFGIKSLRRDCWPPEWFAFENSRASFLHLARANLNLLKYKSILSLAVCLGNVRCRLLFQTDESLALWVVSRAFTYGQASFIYRAREPTLGTLSWIWSPYGRRQGCGRKNGEEKFSDEENIRTYVTRQRPGNWRVQFVWPDESRYSQSRNSPPESLEMATESRFWSRALDSVSTLKIPH